MKTYIAVNLIVTVFISCSKNNDTKPGSGGTTKTTTGGTAKLSTDDSLHLVSFKVNSQIVTTSTSGTSLTLKFNESIDLLIPYAGYQLTSAVHLTEDFKNTLFAGFNFTTVAEDGTVTLDWVDDNLNNVILKTVTDTVINNQKLVKVNVHRTFTFVKVYDSNFLASNEQALLFKKADDVIAFSSYVYYNQKNYLPTSVSAKVIYQ
jgi:hypothetical protein